MPPLRNYVIIDTETTGLNPEDGNEIVQIAAAAINGWDLEDHHAKTFNIYIKPENPDKASPDAIKLIKPTYDKAMAEGITPKVAYQKCIEWVSSVNDEKNVFTRPIYVGHNKDFDLKFLKFGLRKYNIIKSDDELPWAPHIQLDTMTMFFSLFESDPSIKNYKLDTVTSTLGMKRETKYHDAVEDVHITKQILRRIMMFNRECRKRMAIRGTNNNDTPR